MAAHIGAFAFAFVCCGLLTWLLWFAIAKGKLPAMYGGWIERAKSPIAFWFAFVVFAPIQLFFLALTVVLFGPMFTGASPG